MKLAKQVPGSKRTLNRFSSVSGGVRACFPWDILKNVGKAVGGAVLNAL